MSDLAGLGEGVDGGDEVVVDAVAVVRKQPWAVEAERRKRCCIHVDGQEVK